MNTYKLSEICDIFDGPHATPSETPDGPIYLGIRNINETYGLDLTTIKHLSNEDYITWTKRVTPQEDDIVFSYEATLNRYALIPSGFHGCLGRRLAIARVKDTDIVDPHYLFYYFCTKNWKRFILANKVVGSTVLRVSIEDFPHYKVKVPEIQQQRTIASILDSITTKITSNNETIRASERLMREIYDYWFVQFDFPDENGRPYKSSGGEMVYDETLKREIPKGWKAIELGDIIKEAKKSSVQVNGAREKVGAYPFFTSGDEILDFDEYYVDGFNIFLNTGGNADIKSYYGKSAYSTDTWCISADEYSYMLFIFLDSIKEQINNNCFAGSGLKHLQKNAFKKIKIVAPDDNLLRAFNDLAQSFHQAISSYKTENKKLASLRDWLLPMLMNGQVRVEEKTNE